LFGDGFLPPSEVLAEDAGDLDVGYDTRSWGGHCRVVITDRLDAQHVRWYIDEGELVVDKAHERVVDKIVSDVTGEPVESVRTAPSVFPPPTV
jgi:hypothetical protein